MASSGKYHNKIYYLFLSIVEAGCHWIDKWKLECCDRAGKPSLQLGQRDQVAIKARKKGIVIRQEAVGYIDYRSVDCLRFTDE